jgi:hypothetical protein
VTDLDRENRELRRANEIPQCSRRHVQPLAAVHAALLQLNPRGQRPKGPLPLTGSATASMCRSTMVWERGTSRRSVTLPWHRRRGPALSGDRSELDLRLRGGHSVSATAPDRRGQERCGATARGMAVEPSDGHASERLTPSTEPGDGRAKGRSADLTAPLSSGWGDLNSRPLDPQSSALTKLRHSPCILTCSNTKSVSLAGPPDHQVDHHSIGEATVVNRSNRRGRSTPTANGP